MPEKKKQHYVPQFYLKSFSKDKKVNVFVAKTQSVNKMIPYKDQCQEDYLYGKNGIIEDAFGKLEGIASRAIQEIIKTEQKPQEGSLHHEALLYFILAQYGRTKNAAKIGVKMAEGFASVMTEKGISAPSGTEISQTRALKNTLMTCLLARPLLLDLQGQVLVNDSPMGFITCDHPIVFINPFFSKKVPDGRSIGIASRGLTVYVPLSPHIGYLLYDTQYYQIKDSGRITEIGDIEVLNSLTMLSSSETIYFDDSISDADVKRLYKPLSKIHYVKFEMKKIGARKNKELFVGERYVPPFFNELRFINLLSVGPQESAIGKRSEFACRLYNEFSDMVWRRRYKASDWARFFDDKFSEPPEKLGLVEICPDFDPRFRGSIS